MDIELKDELKRVETAAVEGVKNLEKKFGETATLVKEIQEANDLNLKKRDGVLEEKINKMADAVGQIVEAKQRIEQVEVAINRLGTSGGGSSKDGDFSVEAKSYHNLMNGYLRSGIENKDEILALQKKALTVNSDPDGGYFVSPQMSQRIITRLIETSPIRALATTENISSDSLEVISDHNGGTSGGWVGESATRSATNTPQIGKISITAHEQYAQPIASQKLLEDAAVDVERWLAGKISEVFTRTENTAFVSGDGVAKPRGFLTYSAWASAGTYEYNKIEQRNSGTNGGFDFDDLVDLQSDLKEHFRTRAVWLMKRATLATILKLKNATTNEYLINDLRTTNGTGFNLLGNPVRLADDMPVAATGSLSIAYGDFGAAYTIVDRVGISVLRDPFSNKPHVNFYSRKRTGGGVVDFDAIKILKLAS